MDDKIKAYVKNNIRKTASAFGSLAKAQPSIISPLPQKQTLSKPSFGQQLRTGTANPLAQGLYNLPESLKITAQRIPGAINTMVMNPQQAGNLARTAPQYSQMKVPGLQAAANFSANYGQTFGQGLQNMAMGVDNIKNKPTAFGKVQGGAKLLKGAGQTMVPFNVASGLPFLVTNATTSLPQSKIPFFDNLQRFSAGVQHGIAQEGTLSPNIKAKNTINFNIGDNKISFDPTMGVGEMLGFVKNPVNANLFKMTEKVFPAGQLFKKNTNLIKWLSVTPLRGSVENILIDLAKVPENASREEKIKFMLGTAAMGAVSEVVGRGGMDAVSGAVNSKVGKMSQKYLADAFDELKNVYRLANVPVATNRWNNGERVVEPLWRAKVGQGMEFARKNEGFIRLGAEVGGGKPKVSAKSSSEGIIPQDQTKAFNINKTRLKMNKGQSKQFDRVVKTMQPELEKIKGKPLTFDEVTEEAAKSDLLRKSIGREGTANFEAQLTATRNRMVELNNQIDKLQKGGDIKNAERLTKELIQHIRTVSGAAADAGRKLGSFRITAEARPFREQLLSEIIKNQKYSDEQADILVKSAAGVDFNDPAQVTKFFKEVVKPSVGQMLEEYRYINLLSSPRTHITNIFSNAIQAGVLNPATKLTTGIVDPVARALTGKARENYIGEVPMYYRGMFSSFPEAYSGLREVFQGKRALTNLDFKTLQRMPSKANLITKSLEGFDVFFRTLIEGGEKQALDYKFGKMGKEVGQETIDNIASQRGQYFTFRQGFDTPGQGAVLDWFDKGTQAVMQLRRVPGVSWFVPFIQTPMNIVKQGYEYSPAGFSTMIKADNKTEQFSKALLGSAVFTGAGYLALNDRLTYAAPRDPEQKKLFYASGKQPYSVKIGDKWVSFSKIGPLAYPLALAGAVKYAFEDNPSAVTDDTFEKVTKSLTGAMGFFSDQSYMQGIGDMIKGLEGQEGFNLSKIAGNVATQYVPLSSLQRWVNNIIDPIYRKPKTLVENIKSSVVGQTGDMGYYEDPLGEPSKRQFPLQNAFSPVGVTQENPQWNPLLDMRQKELQGNAILKQQKADLQEKVGLNPASADSGDTKMDAYTAKMQEKMARNRVELTGEAERIEDKIIYQTESGTGTIDLGKVSSLSEDNKYLKAIKSSKAFTIADDIIESNLPDEVKNQALSDIGIDREDAEYYSIASQSNDLKSIYLLEVAQAFVNNSGNRQDMIDVLVSQRRKVNGDMIASDGVLDNLYNDGYITNEERKALKDIDFDAEGKLKVKPSSGGKKLKAVKAPTYKLSRKARQKLRKPKLASIKLEGSKKLKTTKPKKFAPIKLVNSKK